MKTNKKRKVRYRNLGVFIVPLVVVMGLMIYLGLEGMSNIAKSDPVVSKPLNSIEKMDYHLREKATDFQIEEFQKLVESVDGKDGELIAEAVVRNFVADFYTWTNKSASYDVGGLYYVYSPQKTTIFMQARDTFYKFLNFYIEEFGNSDLLEVASIESTVSKSKEPFVIDDEEYESYYIECVWKYKDTDKFDTSIFDTNGYFNVIERENGRFEIVVSYGDK